MDINSMSDSMIDRNCKDTCYFEVVEIFLQFYYVSVYLYSRPFLLQINVYGMQIVYLRDSTVGLDVYPSQC